MPCSLLTPLAKLQVRDLLQGVPELGGVGITRVDGGYAVKVNLSAPPQAEINLPGEIDGVPIRVEVVGRVTKRPAP